MTDSALPVMEMFLSIQGEGFHSGRTAYFIRLGGCDVGCVWCDVKESWDDSLHPKKEINEIVDQASQSGAGFAVITGGEPAMYDLTELTKALHKAGLEIAIETSGAHPVRGEFDWICLSPKKFKLPLEESYSIANELKVIVFNNHDFDWSEEQRLKVSDSCRLYLQPEWDKREKMLPLIVEYVKKNNHWNVSLQTHKYMNIP